MRFDPSGPHEVEWTDVEYARPGGEPLLARVYRPRATGPWPALVDVHGGAWAYFDRTGDATFDWGLAACGMVVVALDFRHGAAHRFPASIRDVLAGVRYVRTNAAALARYRYLEPFVDGRVPVPTDEPFFEPVLLREGQQAHFGDEATMARASIPRILAAREFQALPPIWVARAERDRNLTAGMLDDLVAAYRAAGGAAELAHFAGVGHSFANFPGPDADRCIERMRAFIAGCLPPHLVTRRTSG